MEGLLAQLKAFDATAKGSAPAGDRDGASDAIAKG